MHPIMFRIPLGGINLPIGWILIAVGAALVILAGWLFYRKQRSNALTAAAAGVAAIVARFYLHSKDLDTYDVGDIPIYSYGVMLGLSLVVGWYLTLGLAERDGLPRETMANNYVITAVSAVVCSRLLYILTNLEAFDSFWDIFSLRQGGLVAYGGFIGGYLGSWAYLKKKRIRLMPWADVAVPSLASGLMITRIGCYLYGCDYGKRLDTETAPGWLQSLGTFPKWAEGTAPEGQGAPAWYEHIHLKEDPLPPDALESFPVHPTQLYESLTGACLLALLLLARRRQTFRGQIFFLFAFSYGTIRFLLELLRADPERGFIQTGIDEHLLLPFCMVLFAVSYAISFAHMVKPLWLRRITQVVAFVPAVWFYLAKRPGVYGEVAHFKMSTSQLIGLATAVAVGIAFVVFHRAAQAHPQDAMALGLPEPETDDEGKEEAEDEDEAKRRARRRRARRARALADGEQPTKRRKKKKKRKRKVEEPGVPGEAKDEAKAKAEAKGSAEGAGEGGETDDEKDEDAEDEEAAAAEEDEAKAKAKGSAQGAGEGGERDDDKDEAAEEDEAQAQAKAKGSAEDGGEGGERDDDKDESSDE